MANTYNPNEDENLMKAIADHQYTGLIDLYTTEPQTLNLFYLAEFYDPYEYKESDYLKADVQEQAKEQKKDAGVLRYRLQSIELHDQSYSYDSAMWNSSFHKTSITNIELSNNITIKWVEDSHFSIRRMHEAWLNSWYNRRKDCFVNGIKGKYRNLVLYVYHFINTNTESAVPVFKPEVIARITIERLTPEGLNSLTFDYSTSGNEELPSYKYKASLVKIDYFNDSMIGNSYLPESTGGSYLKGTRGEVLKSYNESNKEGSNWI